MRTIFAKLFLLQLFFAVSILLSVTFISMVALKSSVSNWNIGKKEDLEKVLLPVVFKSYRFNGRLSAERLKEALEPYMTESIFVYVFDEHKNPLLLIDRGEEISINEFERQLGSVHSFLSKNIPRPMRDGDKIIGYLSVSSADFYSYKANRLFVSSMTKVVQLGLIIVTAIVLLISVWASSVIARSSQTLVEGISQLSKGKRDVVFAYTGTVELDKIVQAAIALQNQLKKEEKLREQWMQDISHDLCTPVAAIKAQFEGMVDGVLDINKRRIENILCQVNDVELLVRNLQELSKYESPEMKITKTQISMKNFMEDIHERFSFLCDQRNLAFECEGADFYFSADEYLLGRCLSNIVQNALQNTKSGGKIAVRSCIGENGEVSFSVANTGHIPEKHLPHLFDRLYRGNAGRTSGGSGLGLSIVKAICDLHGGSVSAKNVADTAVFTVSLVQ